MEPSDDRPTGSDSALAGTVASAGKDLRLAPGARSRAQILMDRASRARAKCIGTSLSDNPRPKPPPGHCQDTRRPPGRPDVGCWSNSGQSRVRLVWSLSANGVIPRRSKFAGPNGATISKQMAAATYAPRPERAKLYLSTVFAHDAFLHISYTFTCASACTRKFNTTFIRGALMKSLICTGGIALAFALTSVTGAEAQKKMTLSRGLREVQARDRRQRTGRRKPEHRARHSAGGACMHKYGFRLKKKAKI